MKKFLINSLSASVFTSFLFGNLTIFAASQSEVLSEDVVNRLVAAIERIENSKKYPFGIKSIPLKGDTEEERYQYARRICRNTVVNNYARWVKAGKPGSYLTYLGSKYCPPADDPMGHKNWIKNIRKISGLDF